MNKSPRELYDERIKRVKDAIALNVPDRVPIVSPVQNICLLLFGSQQPPPLGGGYGWWLLTKKTIIIKQKDRRGSLNTYVWRELFSIPSIFNQHIIYEESKHE